MALSFLTLLFVSLAFTSTPTRDQNGNKILKDDYDTILDPSDPPDAAEELTPNAPQYANPDSYRNISPDAAPQNAPYFELPSKKMAKPEQSGAEELNPPTKEIKIDDQDVDGSNGEKLTVLSKSIRSSEQVTEGSHPFDLSEEVSGVLINGENIPVQENAVSNDSSNAIPEGGSNNDEMKGNIEKNSTKNQLVLLTLFFILFLIIIFSSYKSYFRKQPYSHSIIIILPNSNDNNNRCFPLSNENLYQFPSCPDFNQTKDRILDLPPPYCNIPCQEQMNDGNNIHVAINGKMKINQSTYLV